MAASASFRKTTNLFCLKPTQAALELTQAAFGAAHPLTGHRLLRLASVRIGQSRGGEAAPLLAVVIDMLGPYPEVSF